MGEKFIEMGSIIFENPPRERSAVLDFSVFPAGVGEFGEQSLEQPCGVAFFGGGVLYTSYRKRHEVSLNPFNHKR